MAKWQARSKQKVTGKKYAKFRKKRKYEMGRESAHTKLGKTKVKKIRTMGANEKKRAIFVEYANVFDPKNKRYQKVKIKKILENPANRHFIRLGIITKGAIVETEIGKAKITSRTGQIGFVNAILVE